MTFNNIESIINANMTILLAHLGLVLLFNINCFDNGKGNNSRLLALRKIDNNNRYDNNTRYKVIMPYYSTKCNHEDK